MDEDLKPAFRGLKPDAVAPSIEARLAEERALTELEAEYLHGLAELKIKSTPGRDMTGQLAAALANRELLKILAGEYPITNIVQALKVIEVATKIVQIADGNPDGDDGEQLTKAQRKEIAAQLRSISKGKTETAAE